MTDWWDFVTRYMALRELKASQVAERARFNKSRMTSWSEGRGPTPKLARDTALALGAPVLEAFVAAGFLEPADTDQIVEVSRGLDGLSDEELLAEVARRLRTRSMPASATGLPPVALGPGMLPSASRLTLHGDADPASSAFLQRLETAKELDSLRQALDDAERASSRESAERFADTAGIAPHFVEEWTTRLSLTNDAVQRIAQVVTADDGADRLDDGLHNALWRIDELLRAGHDLAREIRDKDLHATSQQLEGIPPILRVGWGYLGALDGFLSQFSFPEAFEYTGRMVGGHRYEIELLQASFARAHQVLRDCGLTSEPPLSDSSDEPESAAAGLRGHRERLREVQDGDHGAEQPG